MRTAEECLDVIADAHNCPDVAITEAIQMILDEAIAHGMTLSAEVVVENNQPVFDLPTRLHTRKALGQAILTARDNKVWKVIETTLS